MVSECPPLVLGLSLRCDRRAPHLARRALDGALNADPVLDDARLITSELVNHAVLASGCAADDLIRIMVQVDRGLLLISVHFPSVSPSAPGPPPLRDDSETVRLGLRVVEHIAELWGAEVPDSHRLWAALPLDTA